MRKDSYDINRNNTVDSAEKIARVDQQAPNTVYGRNQNGITGFYPIPVSQVNGKTGSVLIGLSDILFNPIYISAEEIILQNNLAYYEQSTEFSGYTLQLPLIPVEGSFIYISKNSSYKVITLVGLIETATNLVLDRPNQYVMLHCVDQKWRIIFYGNPQYQLSSFPISPMEDFLYIPKLYNYQSIQLTDPGLLSEWKLITNSQTLRFNPATRALQFINTVNFNLDEIVFYLVSKSNPDLFDKLIIKTSLVENISFRGKVHGQKKVPFKLIYFNPNPPAQSVLSFVGSGNSAKITNQLSRISPLLTKIVNPNYPYLDQVIWLGKSENKSFNLTRAGYITYIKKTTQNRVDQFNFSGKSFGNVITLVRSQPKISSVVSYF